MPTHSLNGGNDPIDLGNGISFAAPNARGTLVSTSRGSTERTRSFGEESFDAQLESAGLTRVKVVELENVTTTLAAGEPGTRDLVEAAPPAGTLTVDAGDGNGAVVLVEDENGGLHWVLPREIESSTREFNAAGVSTFSFVIPLQPTASGTRAFGFLKKIVKVFTFPVRKVAEVVENILGDIGAGFIRRWEGEHRKYLVCSYGVENYRAPDHTKHEIRDAAWPRLAAGRALLFVHGTFSSCDAFFGITPEVMKELDSRYEGRLFAFNHPTMADDPTQNADRLLGELPPGTSLDVDIVCHSRGGLVAREIARLGATRGMKVGRIVMVGVPNGGTALADKEHMVGLISRLTTIAKFFPSRAATIAVDALVVAVKVLARALLEDIPGLKAMNPSEDFIRTINSQSSTLDLFAIVSNFEPPPGTPLFSVSRATDAAADLAFGRNENDLVVPTQGGFAVNAAGFPVPDERRFLFSPDAGVIHTEYFAQDATHQRLKDWLQTGVTRDLAVVAARGLAPEQRDALRPHVINLSNGGFSGRGSFTTSKADVDQIFSRDLPAWVQQRQNDGAPIRIAIWAHGGLINEKDGLEIAFKHVAWWKANGVYPIYFVWETGLFDALGSLLSSANRTAREAGTRGFTDFTDHIVEGVARRLRGDLIWGAMKTNAARCSSSDGAASYVAAQLKTFCDANAQRGVELHAVGHSAGSIFHSHFLPAAHKAGVPNFATLQLLAPAIRVDAFKQRLMPLLGKSVQALTMYSMTDDYERRDSCLGVYRKSLLYLIHHSLEEEDRAPILGLQAAVQFDPALATLFNGAGTRASAIWSVTNSGALDSTTRSTSHGGFDDDAATMTSVIARVLATTDPAKVRPYVGDARTGREWPLSADIASAVAPRMAVEATEAAPALTAPVAVIAAPSRGGGRRLGLCIGIDNYSGGNQLFGCVNDARLWKRLLTEKLHFDRVETLLNEQATRAGIAGAVEGILRDAKTGDTVVIQYSGHGTSLPDDDRDEADGTDEAIVPIDFDQAHFVTDDDIRGFLVNHLQEGVSLTIFMDCCHSGTITRMLGRTAAEPLPGVRARFMRVDDKIVSAYTAQRALDRKDGKVASFADRTSLKWVNFSACDATEKALEQNGQGDFTRHATSLIAAGIDISNQEFQRRLVQLFGDKRRQTPQLDCPLEAEGVGLLQFVAGAAVAAAAPEAERRGGDRRGEAQISVAYDRRAGFDRRSATAAAQQLRGIADLIESSMNQA